MKAESEYVHRESTELLALLLSRVKKKENKIHNLCWKYVNFHKF